MNKTILKKSMIKTLFIMLGIIFLFISCEKILPEQSSSLPESPDDITEEQKEEDYEKFYKETKAQIETLGETLLDDVKNPKVSISWVTRVLKGIEEMEGHAKDIINYDELILPEKYRSTHYDLKENMEVFLNISDRAKTSLQNFDVEGLKNIEKEVTTIYSDLFATINEMDGLMEG